MRSRFVAVALLGAMGAWMVVTGAFALVTGDYPEIDTGPWSDLAAAVGIDPSVWVVRAAHVGVGMMAIGAAFSIATGWGALAWWLGVVASLAVMWRVPFGTVAGAVSLVVLLLPGPRVAIRGE